MNTQAPEIIGFISQKSYALQMTRVTTVSTEYPMYRAVKPSIVSYGDSTSVEPEYTNIQFERFEAVSSLSDSMMESTMFRPEHLIDVMYSQIANKIDIDFMGELLRLGTKNYLNTFTRWDKFKFNAFKTLRKHYVKRTRLFEDKELGNAISRVAHDFMFRDTRNGRTYAICSPELAYRISSLEGFQHTEKRQDRNTFVTQLGIYYGVTICLNHYSSAEDDRIIFYYRCNENSVDEKGDIHFMLNSNDNQTQIKILGPIEEPEKFSRVHRVKIALCGKMLIENEDALVDSIKIRHYRVKPKSKFRLFFENLLGI